MLAGKELVLCALEGDDGDKLMEVALVWCGDEGSVVDGAAESDEWWKTGA